MTVEGNQEHQLMYLLLPFLTLGMLLWVETWITKKTHRLIIDFTS